MDAVRFFKEQQRMCNEYKRCGDCPFSRARNFNNLSCDISIKTDPAEAVAIVEAWSKTHPVTTNKDKYKEIMKKYFDADINIHIDTDACTGDCPPVYTYNNCDQINNCKECLKWWNEEYQTPESEE